MLRRIRLGLFSHRNVTAPILAALFALLSSTAIFADAVQSDRLKAAIYDNPGMLIVADHMLDKEALSRFYALREYQLAWSGDEVGQRRADIAIDRIAHANEEGLEPADYRADELSGLRKRLDSAQFDLILTDALIHYARDLRTGRSSIGFVDRDVALPPVNFDAAQTAADLFQQKDFEAALTGLEPPHKEYAHLKIALAKYRAIVSMPDSRVDAQNEAVADKIDQIVANMERWRWLGAFEPAYIAVNIPEAQLTVQQDGQTVLVSKIIVGKPKTPTPIFRALVIGVTANPVWNVPTSIAAKEILPKQRRDPGYLAKHHMIFTASGGVQQLPGADNALGTLKLEMPNQFDTYLHDTPTKSLFARNARYFSHGCMRVEQILPLASVVLTGDSTSALTELRQAIATGATQHLTVEKKLPVYVLYWTVVANENGDVTFFPDIYGRDRRLIAALHGMQPRRLAALNGNSCEVSRG